MEAEAVLGTSVWTAGVMKLEHDQLIEAYRRMSRIRQFEETTKELLLKGQLYGAFHTSTGQEASIVGSCLTLEDTDYMVGTHRSHGHPIGKGANIKGLMAELFGRVDGVNQGKGGSMHLSDFSIGSLGETSIVGSGLPVATGAGLGSKMQGEDKVTLCFFGDGASNEGTFHESLNIASIWELPVVYVCENNGYGELTAWRKVVASESIAARSVAYDMPGIVVDGQDVVAVYEAVKTAVDRARAGDGPSLVETRTYRYENHAIGLPMEAYRDAEEVEDWRANRDPLILFRDRTDDFGIDMSELDAIDLSIAEEVDAAVEFAKASPEPAPEEAFTNVFTEPVEIRR
ncbi:MAG TPA: thiamine pyrophosphate-dependent dehydrogenase E1 component subunit alpha [Enteractinococcus helveticum]|uniref:Thiamine pyrophosphate-dependent dehydrogenase E1 component subunit alpha n=1 Tax=Enteractinococcus helveticum TaxID=1837282 RepID=A0A921FQN7_9MICC|nr:thiamine pyrophosphate-dependent dehydrogenase E1 component subunit alpha [Enteractinococcus helveticum]HJF15717.1 thiamine pyrophosphate-dependent dehydrogenase E1 component subunit alpha [Enteractinococcus helveticum]